MNPRSVLAVSRFQGECIRPLCHATADKRRRSRRARASRAARSDFSAAPIRRQFSPIADDLRPRQPAEEVRAHRRRRRSPSPPESLPALGGDAWPARRGRRRGSAPRRPAPASPAGGSDESPGSAATSASSARSPIRAAPFGDLVEHVEQSHVVQRQLMRVDQRLVQRRVQPQRRVEKVLPRALFSNVEARHLARRAPRDDPLHWRT